MGFVRKGLSALTLVVLTLSLVEKSHCAYEKAPNCEKLECPYYDVVNSFDDFEVRNYNSSLWMHTRSAPAASYKEGAGQGFKIWDYGAGSVPPSVASAVRLDASLFAYINGDNKQEMKIDMTAPVVTNIYPTSPQSYEVYFFMPAKFSTFTPRSDVVFPNNLPPKPYAVVRRFSGPLDDATITKELDALKASVKGTPYEPSAIEYYTVAGYNAPFETENRVNEIILWTNQ